MGKVLTIEQSGSIAKEMKNRGKRIVLVGGCFDILHEGHIEFLKRAREEGDVLIVLLESDKRIRKLKGKERPVNLQKERANTLLDLSTVDYVILLSPFKNDTDYEILVKKIEPDIIAITRGSTIYEWEKEYVEQTGTKIVEVMDRKENYSTTNLVEK